MLYQPLPFLPPSLPPSLQLRIQCCVGSPHVKTEEARDDRIALVKTLKATPPHVLVGTMGRICDLAEVGEGGREGGRVERSRSRRKIR